MISDGPADEENNRGFELEAEKLVGGGRALAHHGGDTWLVAGALPGERVRVVRSGRRAGVVEGRVIEVLAGRHPARTDDVCPHADRCGGCDWPFVAADRGAALKAEAAAEAARHQPALAARLREAEVKTSPLAYRLRSRLHWDPSTGGLGFYEPRSWRVTAIPSCRIVSHESGSMKRDACRSGSWLPPPVSGS